MRARSCPAAGTVALLAVLTLAACGDGSEDADGADPTSDAPTATSETSPTPDPADELPANATPPGTDLELGQPATVTFGSEDATGVVEIVVERIRKGTVEDLRALDLGAQAQGYLPYYITYTVTGVRDSSALRNASVDEAVVGVLPDGSGAQALRVIGDWAPCDGVSVPRDFAEGTTFSSCVPYLAQDSTKVSAAAYAPTVGPYNSSDGDPVTWR